MHAKLKFQKLSDHTFLLVLACTTIYCMYVSITDVHLLPLFLFILLIAFYYVLFLYAFMPIYIYICSYSCYTFSCFCILCFHSFMNELLCLTHTCKTRVAINILNVCSWTTKVYLCEERSSRHDVYSEKIIGHYSTNFYLME